MHGNDGRKAAGKPQKIWRMTHMENLQPSAHEYKMERAKESSHQP